MSEVLKVENLRTYFHTKDGKLPAVDGVSFSLEAGKVLGIVGESGCGKSVTSLSIMGLLPPQTTEILPGSSVKLMGEELVGKSNREMCKIRGDKIAMIFQDSMTSLNPVMRVGDQLMETIRVHRKLTKKQAKQEAVAMLKKVGIPNPEARMKNYPHEMSGGMRQRVMIAMALSCSPSVLIADEPTTALDVTIQAQILELMLELRENSNTAVVLITHDMGVVAEMADEIMVMYTGRVVEKGTAAEIFKNPLHPYTQGLLASIPRVDQKVEKLHVTKGMVPNLFELPQGCKFADRCPYASGRCGREEPELLDKDGHLVRCFLCLKGECEHGG
jgi:oligopeptide/dipeptide ABC transporter ATP-binding protein